jgi:hypothetical protein
MLAKLAEICLINISSYSSMIMKRYMVQSGHRPDCITNLYEYQNPLHFQCKSRATNTVISSSTAPKANI